MSKNNIEVGVSIVVRYTIVDPYLFTLVDDGDGAFEDLIERNVRWFATVFNVEELVKKRDDCSSFIKNPKEAISNMVQRESDESKRAEIEGLKGSEEYSDEIARKWGIRIDYVLVNDFNPPQNLIDSWEKEKTEEIEKGYELTETQNFINLINEMKRSFPGMSDEKIADLVQTERYKVKRIVVDGASSDLLKSAVAHKSIDEGGDKNERVD